MTGTLGINKKYLIENYKEINLIENYNEKDRDDAENIAMIISRYLMHEESGHSKFRNKSGIKTGINSPVKCVSEGKIKKLTNLSNNEDSDDLIKIFPVFKKGKGDSGHYLEASFGKYKGIFCITYFDRLKNVGKLLKFPEYFVKKHKLEILRKYLYLKCLIEQNNINLKLYDTFDLSLEAENYLMFRLLERGLQKNLLIEKKQKYINSTQEMNKNKNKEDNNSSKGIEENENESCFTEENVLRDINNGRFDFKEIEGKETIYLNKKRKLSNDDEDDNYIGVNISNEIIEEIIGINQNYLDFDINKIDNLKVKITYDNYIEDEDDEACI